MNDVELKDKGNKYFSQRKYDEAVKCYSDAIAKKPGVCIYYTNRALCHLKCRRWDRVCQDCRAALEIDPMQIKAHFFLGQALLENHSYDESIRHFQRAQDLAKEQKVNYGDDIASLIRVARKKRFAVAEEARVAQEIELQSYLNQLILKDRERLVAIAKSREEGANSAPSKSSSHKPLSHSNPSDCNKENRNPQSVDGEEILEQAVNSDIPVVSVTHDDKHPLNTDTTNDTTHLEQDDSFWKGLDADQITKKSEEFISEVNNMFAKLDERRRVREVPDYLCGKISFDILKDPIVTPSGITYDRKDLEEHLQRVGHFDPITRTKLTVDMLVPNLAMKEVVSAFTEENEWALDY